MKGERRISGDIVKDNRVGDCDQSTWHAHMEMS
jgi:hypothetical protein